METPPHEVLAPNNDAALSSTGIPASEEEDKLAIIDRVLSLQSEELKIRAREAEIEENNQERGFQYSTSVLATQERDRIHEREHGRKSTREKMIGVCILVAIIISGSLIAVGLGDKEFAIELLKYTGTFTAGGAFGYGAKVAGDRKKQGQESK